MNSIQACFTQAELSLASYANLNAGQPNIAELVKDTTGMSATQANKFAETYDVITQYNDTLPEGARAPA